MNDSFIYVACCSCGGVVMMTVDDPADKGRVAKEVSDCIRDGYTLITHESEITLPDTVRCPICKAKVVIDEVSQWNEDDNGMWEADAVKINCETEPDIDSDEWWPWHNRHWSMPYVDWLPLEEAVTRWVNERYRWKQ